MMNDLANAQALMANYVANLESKRGGALTEEDAKEVDDMSQVENHFNRIDSRNKLEGHGRRTVRSRRRKEKKPSSPGVNDDLIDKLLAMSLKKKDAARSLTQSSSSNQAFDLSEPRGKLIDVE
mmetsp:Transcript_38101/g.92210  ORF Transcript_38101/g.92210 Transcript_38101/m.92210 type:complete len:123 (+) Transcript_38101:185-553(+)